MPSYYAHYYFGNEVLRIMPNDVRSIVDTNRNTRKAYILGLQGPDPLFFYLPVMKNSLNQRASRIHHDVGAKFFEDIASILREEPSPERYSYAFGCLCHYMLDSACHPVVAKYMKATGLTHEKLEREFDTYILRICKISPRNLDLEPILPYNSTIIEAIAPFYHIGPRRMTQAVTSMIRALSLLSSKNSTIRRSTYQILSHIPNDIARDKRDMIVVKPDPKAQYACSRFFDSLNKAVADTAIELDHLLDFFLLGTPLGERLQLTFLGLDKEGNNPYDKENDAEE